MVKFSPSLACVDFLHIGDVIRDFEKNNIDYVHFDISDTSFTNCIMLPQGLVAQLKKFTKMPLDIHIMVDPAQDMIDKIIAPLDKNDIISVQVEATTKLSDCLLKAKKVCKCGAVLNLSTPIENLEYVAELLDMVILIQGNGGAGERHDTPDLVVRKVKDVRALLEKHGNTHCEISVDGNVTPDYAVAFQKAGADVLVFGTKALFIPNTNFSDNVAHLREVLKD